MNEEARLLQHINQRLLTPTELDRLRGLQANRRQTGLAETEYDNLTELTDKLEVAHAARLASLVKLAQLRDVTLAEIMAQLEINLPDYD